MIKILDHTKALNLLVNDTTNGLGQFEANSCIITEELNGIYEAEIEMLATDKHFNELSVGGLLQLEVNEAKDKQIFRIYYISKPINQVVQIKAQHITYDLNKIPVRPFTATGAVNTKNGMINNIIGTYPFTMTTDITNTTSVFTLDIPRSFRECLGGYEGSLLDTFRGEYEWDNLTVKMLAHRGSDNDVRISYGKNLTDFTQEENIENVYTSVLGYAVVNEQTYIGNVYHKIQSTYPKVKMVDFSSDYENTVPTTEDLTQKAQSYAENNDIEIPNVNLSISFVPLYQTEEYKNIAPLERVSLGDTVHVYFDKLGVEASARVIKTVWNGNLGRYDSIELGNAKANLNTVLNEVQQQSKDDVETSKSYLEDELNQMATLIINGLGLHRTYVQAGSGYRIYLHNKETLEESDTQYIFTAEGFLVSTDYGQTWNAGFDSEGNAVVNSLSTITLKALEIYGSYMCFGDYPDGKYIEATTYSNSSSVPQGVSFDGTGTIRMQPQEAFFVNNMTADGNNNYNRIVLNKNGSSSNYMGLYNYDDTKDFVLANYIEINSHLLNSSTNKKYNRIMVNNYSTESGTRYTGNYLSLMSYGDSSQIQLYNYKIGTNNTLGNTIWLGAQTTYNQTYLNNYAFGETYNYISNFISLRSTESAHLTTIVNKKTGGADNYANELVFSASSTGTYTTLRNYSYNQAYFTNALYLQSNANYNRIQVHNYKMGTNNSQANVIEFIHTEGSQSVAKFTNMQYEVGSGNRANEIKMTSDSTNKILRISNFRMGTDGEANYIEMKSDANVANNTLTIWSQSDVHINSSGAVRLTSGGSQDITLTASDDIYMVWGNKLRMQGREIRFGTLDGTNILTWV